MLIFTVIMTIFTAHILSPFSPHTPLFPLSLAAAAAVFVVVVVSVSVSVSVSLSVSLSLSAFLGYSRFKNNLLGFPDYYRFLI